jgi:hypothetical protein
MANAYTTALGFEKMEVGQYADAWGARLNTSIDLFEEAIVGLVDITVTAGGTDSVTTTDHVSSEGRHRLLNFTGATADAETTITLPDQACWYFVKNSVTTYDIILSAGGGTNVTLLNGDTRLIYTDGATNVVDMNIQASTISAASDTSAGDNAAMGYTATEGLILTGQGSTSDVTIKNDADAAVIEIPTGTTNVDIVGVATAASFEPDGDTAAGDNAAIGYTAAEGLILTGQGSTNDVTIKNDADADVAVIPTGTTNFDIVGVATAASFEPDGDTAAGDAAAIGYTAAEGLILTGQGSTNDVTIKNDADAEVISIRTGTVDTDFEGTLFLKEAASASADVAAYGQFWVKSDAPNKPWFTDDAGTDFKVGMDVAEINAQTGTAYTAALSDKGMIVTMSNASTNTLTIPANAAVAFPVGSVFAVIMKGAGTTDITGDTGVTLNGVSAGSGSIQTQYNGVTLTKIATDTWIASGDIDTVA